MMRMGEINICCEDLTRSLTFYTEALGFTFVEREAECIRLALGDRRVLLMPASAGGPGGMSFDLMTPDARAEAKRLEALGHEIRWGTYEDFVFFTVRDPNGHEFEVIQTPPPPGPASPTAPAPEKRG